MPKKNVKVKISLPGGATLEVEGDEESVAKTAVEIARQFQKFQHSGSVSVEPKRATKTKRKRPRDYLETLIKEGFLNQWRTIDEIVAEMNANGADITGRSISAVAVTLSRWVSDDKYGLTRQELPEEEQEPGKGISRYRVKSAQEKMF